MDPVSLLVYILIAVLFLVLIYYVLSLAPIDATVRNIILIVVVLLILVWLLRNAGLM